MGAAAPLRLFRTRASAASGEKAGERLALPAAEARAGAPLLPAQETEGVLLEASRHAKTKPAQENPAPETPHRTRVTDSDEGAGWVPLPRPPSPAPPPPNVSHPDTRFVHMWKSFPQPAHRRIHLPQHPRGGVRHRPRQVHSGQVVLAAVGWRHLCKR
eukprot:scaffold8761_cov97-Isochrysis_galbana.AAC.3